MVNAATYILENNSTIQGLVGVRAGGTDYKVFPVVVFESEKAPYIVVRQSGRTSLGENCGSTFNIDVISYAGSYDAVNTLSAAIKTALEGQAANSNLNGIDFGSLYMINEVDGDFVKDHLLYSKIQTFEGIAG